MKKLYTILACTVVALGGLTAQTTLAKWNFTGDSATPAEGTGTISLVGGTTQGFASGVGAPSDTDTTSANRAYNSSTYAALGTEDKQRGVQISVSTLGYAGIVLTFDQRLSNTANNTYVVQYTTNGTSWVDAQTFTFTPAADTGDTWRLRTVDCTAISALNNNANAAFRVVSSFDSTAGNYTASKLGSTYSATGTVRYDNIKVVANTSLGLASVTAKVGMYPNPVVANENLYFDEAISGEIVDLTGKTVLSFTQVQQLGLVGLQSGIYVVKTTEGAVEKLIVR